MKLPPLRTLARLLFCFLVSSTQLTWAQEKPCGSPISLPTPNDSNVFAAEQEIYLGEAIAEHIQNRFKSSMLGRVTVLDSFS